MKKYLNIIIVSFFSFLLLKYEYGLPLIIPIILLYLQNNSKLAILIIPVSILSVVIFNIDCVKTIIAFYILVMLYLLVFMKKNNIILDVIYELILCFGMLIINANELINENIYMFAIYSVASCVFYLILKLLLQSNFNCYPYFELISIALALIGSSELKLSINSNINISFYLSVFYAIYFSYNSSGFISLVFSLLISFYLYFVFKLEYVIIIPFISIIYMFNSIASGFITVLLTTILCFIMPKYYKEAIIIDLICILFELLKTKMIGKKITKEGEIKEGVKDSLDILNKNCLAFSSFLDMCAQETKGTKEYYRALDEGIKSIESNYCNKCYLCNKCYQNDVNEEIKNIIINSKNITYDIKNSPVFSVCPYNVEIRKSAILINERINNNINKSKQSLVSSTLNGVSNMIRQFTIDNNIQKEISYENVYKLKKAISSNGFVINYFKVEKLTVDDFLIEIGIRGNTFEDVKEKLEKISSKSFGYEVSIEYDYNENGKIYLRIIPKVKCKIEYSSSSIAYGKVSGDNILINETKDGKVISLICDGMGKGYNANMSSEFVVEMFEQLLKTTLSSYAIIQMINTYCEIKESIDNFCTLDYMEIDKKNKELVFYKMSSAPSIVFHNDKTIEIVDNKRLPLGKESEIISENVKVQEGDIIVMSSDGIFENIKNQNELNEYIQSITYLPTPKIVYKIISYIKEASKLTDDDISLVVLKVLPC